MGCDIFDILQEDEFPAKYKSTKVAVHQDSTDLADQAARLANLQRPCCMANLHREHSTLQHQGVKQGATRHPESQSAGSSPRTSPELEHAQPLMSLPVPFEAKFPNYPSTARRSLWRAAIK